MDKVDNALNELKNELDNLPIVQEYLNLKSILENDEELKAMRLEIARLTSEGKNKEKEALLEIYNSHPIVSNYTEVREEIVSLLREIKEVLSD